MFRLLFDGKSSESGVSSFQALAMSLAGRVGTRISQGSHGYCFWGSWSYVLDVDGCIPWSYTAFINHINKFIKKTLRTQFRGGPAFYIERGLG
jgi:AGCS family alanine or glycine:cation symporter